MRLNIVVGASLLTLTVMCGRSEAQVLYSGPLAPGSTVTSQQPIQVAGTIEKYGLLELKPGKPTSINVDITASDLASKSTTWKRSTAPVVFTVRANTETRVVCDAALTLVRPVGVQMSAESTLSVPSGAIIAFINPPPDLPPGSVRGYELKAGSTEITTNVWAKPPGGRWGVSTLAGTYNATLTMTMTARS